MSKLISNGELKVKRWLDEHRIRYEFQKRFSDCKDKHCLPFDFYLPDYKVAIEYQGQQHFKVNKLFAKKYSNSLAEKQLEKQKLHDKIKKDYCETNNIYLIAIIYDENVENVMNFEYSSFKMRFDKDNDFIFNNPEVNLQGNVFKRLSVETTGTRYCEICNKEFKPKVLSSGIISDETVCSLACSKERTRRHNLEKYGYESPNQSPEIKKKQQESNLKRYGVKNGGVRKEALKKAIKTNIERYGVENGAKSEKIREKISKAKTKYVFIDETNELLKKLYIEDNLSVKEISLLMSISYSRILRQISNLDLHRSGSKLISKAKTKYDMNKEELENLRKLGFTHKEIMKKTGLSKKALELRLKKFNLVNPKKSANTNNIKYTTETWIEKAKSIHGDIYDYSLVDYKDSKTKVKIICRQCGRVFEQNPNHHLRGCGCKYCQHKK